MNLSIARLGAIVEKRDEDVPIDEDSTESTEGESSVATQASKLTKRFGKHITSSLTAAVIARLMSLLLLKMLAVTLTKSDYGRYSLWFSLMFLTATLSTSPFSATLWRFLQSDQFEKASRKARLLSTATVGSLLISMTVPALLYAIHGATGHVIAEDPFYLLSLTAVSFLTVSYIFKEIVLVVSGTEQNSKEILVFGIMLSSGSFLAAAAFTLLLVDFRATLIGSFLGMIIPALIIYRHKLRVYGYARPNLDILKKCFSYGGPLIIVATVSSALSFIVSFFVGMYTGLTQVATLGVSLTVGSIVGFIVGPPLTAYNAFLVNSYESDCFDSSDRISARIIEMFISFSTVALVLIFSAAPIVVTLIASEAYLDAVPLLPFIVFSTLVLSFSQFWKLRLDLVQKTHIVGIAYFLSLVVLIISCVIAVPVFGVTGAALALVLQSLTVLLLVVPAGQRYLRISIPRSFFGKWFVAVACLIAAERFLSPFGILMPIRGFLAGCVFVGVMLVTRAHRLDDIKQMVCLLLPSTLETGHDSTHTDIRS